MNNKDYVFYLNWEDNQDNPLRVGYLARIEEAYYLLISNEKNAESAYERGFIGIPGFKAGEIYRSQELFDFFKNRVLDKQSPNPCEELARTKGKSMIDSFSLEQASEIMLDKHKRTLLEAYEKQEKLKKVKNKNEIEVEYA